MIRKYSSLIGLGLVLAAGVSTPALATESGLYLGLNFGQSKFSVDEDAVEEFFEPFDSQLDDSDTALSFTFGYRFSRHIALEAAYVDMGEVVATGGGREVSGPFVIDGSAELTASVKGVSFAMVGAIPVNNFEFNAKLGVFFASTEIGTSSQVTVRQGPTIIGSFTDAEDESASTTEIIYGLGMGYTFGEHFHVRIDWTMVPDAGDEEKTTEGDVSAMSAGFQYRF